MRKRAGAGGKRYGIIITRQMRHCHVQGKGDSREKKSSNLFSKNAQKNDKASLSFGALPFFSSFFLSLPMPRVQQFITTRALSRRLMKFDARRYIDFLAIHSSDTRARAREVEKSTNSLWTNAEIQEMS